MAKIIWLASYPKSGNTWMRALLTNYLSDSGEPADINKLTGGPIASARVWFDEWAGVEASALDDVVTRRLRPEIYRCLAREADETLFMKVHDAWGLTDRGEPLFPPDVTAGVVYIVRNPLDLVASCAHHWGVKLEDAVERLSDPAMADRKKSVGLGDQLRQHLGSWSDHASSWVERSGLRVHVVRYEDLCSEPVKYLNEFLGFCDLPQDPNRVAKAIAFSSFDELQRQEHEGGFRERSAAAPGPFFRQGRTERWTAELSEDLIERVLAAHGQVMRRFGYASPDPAKDKRAMSPRADTSTSARPLFDAAAKRHVAPS